jgi:hypothetical protein
VNIHLGSACSLIKLFLVKIKYISLGTTFLKWDYQDFRIKICRSIKHYFYYVNENLGRMRLEDHVAQIEAK